MSQYVANSDCPALIENNIFEKKIIFLLIYIERKQSEAFSFLWENIQKKNDGNWITLNHTFSLYDEISLH